ncbi:Formylglycine-generating enzyme, required for sulfatase activity, contains SUMF1/FGE domain [Filimonas lacunae]|uniref:Formylglycine-generating enzyme, required for sulfatase activity, contains SUMF1/FGE domain n=1 Tax=Filimonas lacunae TaxID=477680 RepID=A0A173ME89_9BACT|nr:SUMF1/EgtB/PvdO family nonheme iron enzyme [Filimonas lacunae]BAV05904.1 sulfatase modifying factor 1 precursor [Filimonas lacunae]SIT34538.1 Formylglycine-generating enzyme, required for sulfatase activity, contains SUMF1/FGE domain [Filimonas lacunae]
MLAGILLHIATLFGTVSDTDFVRIPAGPYTLGRKGHAFNPLHTVQVNSFYIGATEVTNRQFVAFVAATQYITDAEKRHNALVFEPGLDEFRWKEDSTACWRFPNGIAHGGIDGKINHPVTTISYHDIQAYCQWAGVRLPTLDEWEVAARAGASTAYFWGDDIQQAGQYANIWHGHDHLTADSTDGYMYTSPVGSFQPNAYGLYDVYGNVFEFCEGHVKKGEQSVHARGGSWWCSRYACGFFNNVDIGRVNPHASFSNQGFRVVCIDR